MTNSPAKINVHHSFMSVVDMYNNKVLSPTGFEPVLPA